MKINYKSDFNFKLKLMVEVAGEFKEIGVPQCDWVLSLYVGQNPSKADTYVAKCVNGNYTNCSEDDGRILVVADEHGLPRGSVWARLDADIEDASFPDGKRHLSHVQATGIELVGVGGEDGDTFPISLALPEAFGGMVSGWRTPDPDPLSVLTDLAAGKAKIAAALAECGVEASASESLDSLAEKILTLKPEAGEGEPA